MTALAYDGWPAAQRSLGAEMTEAWWEAWTARLEVLGGRPLPWADISESDTDLRARNLETWYQAGETTRIWLPPHSRGLALEVPVSMAQEVEDPIHTPSSLLYARMRLGAGATAAYSPRVQVWLACTPKPFQQGQTQPECDGPVPEADGMPTSGGGQLFERLLCLAVPEALAGAESDLALEWQGSTCIAAATILTRPPWRLIKEG